MSVVTVNGLLPSENLGVTLPHEHLFVDLRFAYVPPQDAQSQHYASDDVDSSSLHLLKYNPGLIRSNLVLEQEDLAARELARFKSAGGGTIVEQSSIGAGRREEQIKRISASTGVHIIAGCGYYMKQSLPRSVVDSSVDELTRATINEVTAGIGGTGIRPGIIGEIGIGPVIGEWEKKILVVAARAQKETGRPVSVHIQAVPAVKDFSGPMNGVQALEILEREGADLGRVIICHADARCDLGYINRIIELGAYAEFDHFGKEFYYVDSDFLMDRDIERVLTVKELIESGRGQRVLISQDVCLKTDLVMYGGTGYAHILENIVPAMLRKGITREAIDTIMVENPRRILDVDHAYL